MHQIKKYLGQVSQRMAERYAKVVSSEIDDVLERVWVGGPGSANPGKLLVSPAEGLTKAEAEAMALDLSRPQHTGRRRLLHLPARSLRGCLPVKHGLPQLRQVRHVRRRSPLLATHGRAVADPG
ncbi:hypothetical protein [Streptomyces sp. NPDC001889]